MAVEWRDIPGLPYQASNSGKIRRKNTGRILVIYYRPKDGYGRVTTSVNGLHYVRKVSHLVCEAFLGKRPRGLVVNHKNGIRRDDRVKNLEYVTQSENALHAYRIGLSSPRCGELHGQSKLKDADVLIILKSNKNQNELSKMFGVYQSVISRIKNKKAWSHINNKEGR